MLTVNGRHMFYPPNCQRATHTVSFLSFSLFLSTSPKKSIGTDDRYVEGSNEDT